MLNLGENVLPIVLYIVHLGEIWVTLGFLQDLQSIYAQIGACSHDPNATKNWGSLDRSYSLLIFECGQLCSESF